MIQLNLLNDLCDNFGIEALEKGLIKLFIDTHKLDITNNGILEEYFNNYSPDSKLFSKINKYNKMNLKDLENCLELIIPKDDRKLNGAFFTPSYIVEFIINAISPKEDDKNLDTSCGCGAFLIYLVEYYYKKYKKSISQILRENIYGVDILPYNVKRAKILLTLYGLLDKQNIRKEDFNILNINSLKVNWENLFINNPTNKFNNIIGNPPYVRFQDLPEDMRQGLVMDWKSISNGNFNLYFAFFELGYSLLTPDGNLGYITPNNYFTSLAGESLRRYFQERKCIAKIIDFNCKKVFDAQTYTAITFLNKNTNLNILYDRIDDGKSPEYFLKNINLANIELKSLNVKKWRLLKSDEQTNIKKIETIGYSLGELFEIRVGIATLKDEIYFINGNAEKGEYYIKIANPKAYKIEKEITRKIYKISEFKNQDECNLNTKRIIFPYYIQGNNAYPINEEIFKEKYPQCYIYFVDMKEELKRRDKGKLKIIPWYAYGRSQGLTKIGEKIITPTFSRFPRFLMINDEEALFCNGYGIYFKKEIGLFGKIPLITQPENADVLLKILNSMIMHYYVSKTSVSIEGGYPCYQKNFIEKFTIPTFSLEEIEELKITKDKKKIDFILIKKYGLEI